MRVIIEVEKDEELAKIKKTLKGEKFTVVKTQKERKKMLESIFKRYNVKLPADYKFSREEIHAR